MESIQNNKTYKKEIFKDLSLDLEEFSDLEFIECKFENCSMMEVKMIDSVFEKCKFENVNMGNAKLNGSSLQNCSFRGSKLIGIDFSLLNTKLGIKLDCVSCDMSYTFFPEITLNKSSFIKCKFIEADFNRSSLKNVTFSGSDLTKTRFVNCNLLESDMREVKNLYLDPSNNKCKGMKISPDSAENLLAVFGISVDGMVSAQGIIS